MFRFASTLVAVAVAATTVTAAAAADVKVKDAWARASAGTARAGGAFMTIVNTGTVDDRLVAAEAPVSESTELHTHIHEGSVMRMRQVDEIAVPAGETVQLKPGGLHVMFMGLNEPLREGQTFDLELTFEKAGAVTVPVRVLAPGAMGTGMTHDSMNHGAMSGDPGKANR